MFKRKEEKKERESIHLRFVFNMKIIDARDNISESINSSVKSQKGDLEFYSQCHKAY